jgi:glycosyltransferase involved in cell wall biosynthesis
MPENSILYSVIIPCFNAEKWIESAVRSVHAQGVSGVEVIVVDDGSTDESLQVLRGLGDLVRWEAQANAGACTARNRGVN